jgi:type II secretory pathway predicted ATPase ExeA
MSNNQLIETRNTKKVKSAIATAVSKNQFVAVVAEVGSGKTTIFNTFTDYWQSIPSKFNMIRVKGWNTKESRVPAYVKMMIEQIAPDIDIPHEMERRYDVLNKVLLESYKNRRKTILIIDEAQDLRSQTFRDLKKIHEISGEGQEHLFSIICLGKPSHRWDAIFRTAELGFRIKLITFQDLRDDEVIEIAEKRFGLKFLGDMVKKRFCNVLMRKIPLAIQNFADVVSELQDFNGQVNERTLLDYHTKGFRIRMKMNKVKVFEAEEAINKRYPTLNRVRQSLSEFLNGHLDPDTELSKKFSEVLNDLIDRRAREASNA